MSNNYYKPAWTLKSHRRLKNVICAMEWLPPGGSASAMASSTGWSLEHDKAMRVRAAFGFFDEDHDGTVTASELAALGRAVDLHTVAQFASGSSPDVGALPQDAVAPLVQEQLGLHMDGPGTRFWIVLSLAEAETLRGALHISAERGDGQLCAGHSGLPPLVALHTHDSLLDAVNHAPDSAYERDVVHACFRFLASSTEYDTRQQHLLLRCLQANEPKARQAAFCEVRACRRRRQSGWEKTGSAPILEEPDEFTLFEHRALLAATTRRLRSRGLSLRQAFHAFNSSRTGAMSASELFSALRWLDLHATVQHVHEAVRRLDTDEDGFLTAEDFVAGFSAADDTADAALSALATVSPLRDIVIPLQRIPELFDSQSGGATARPPAMMLSTEELREFVATLVPCARYKPAVREFGGTRGLLYLWQPMLERVGANRVTVVLGHCATTVPGPPGKFPADRAGCPVLELRDRRGSGFRGDASVRLQAALDQLLPVPTRYVAVWSSRGEEPLTIWMAVPPTKDFAALGVVATAGTTANLPPFDAMRCVPKEWVRRAPPPEELWSGAEGSVWRGAQGLVVATKPSRSAPACYELKIPS